LRRSADLRVNAYAPLASVVTAGVQLEEQRERSATETLSEFGASSGSFDVNRLDWGYYAQLRSTPSAPLDVTVGARVDDNDTFGTFLSYRGGAVLRVSRGTRLRASVGKSFKEPTFYENFADAPFAVGNPGLLPERSIAWEVGVEQRMWGDRIGIGVTYFDQQFRDLIQYTFSPPGPGEQNFFNVAAADSRGMELEALANPGWGMTLRAGYTYLHTEVVDAGFDEGPGGAFVEGERLLRRPPHAFGIFIGQAIGSRGTLTGALRYVGERDDRDFSKFPAEPVVLPAYVIIDLSGEMTVWRGTEGRPRLDVTGRITNLLNQDYQQVFGFLTAGRAIVAGVKVGL
jgi:vitamin B12 transporter